MGAEVVSKVMRPARRDWYVTVMDDYGAPMHLALPMSLTLAQREAKITAAIVTMNAGQTQIERTAVEEKFDLSTAKKAGIAAKAAAKKKAAG
jgi:hypothetical protein